jgi:transposase
MHAAQIASIDDIETLRRIALGSLDLVIARDALIAEHEALITAHRHALAEREAQLAERDMRIAERDARIAERDALISTHGRTIVFKDATIDALTQELARLRRLQYAAKSERFDPAQREMFDEAMAADLAAVEAQLDVLRAAVDAEREVPAKPRTPPQRRPLPPELERVEIRHEPASCACAACGGALHPIGEQVSEKLDLIPLKFFVRRHVYPQYACRACETVTAAPVAPTLIERGVAAPGLLAQVVIGKYVDHLPLYRQEKLFERAGLAIPRNVQAEWIGHIGVALAPLAAALKADLLTRPILHADETPVAQLDPGKGQTKRAYLFAYCSAEATGPPIILFDYGANRSGQHVRDFLGDWRGALMVDDFAGYKKLFEAGVTELGCFAHARRKFHDLYEASKSPIAAEALVRIQKLYWIEAEAREAALDAQARHRLRQAKARPLIDDLQRWLLTIRPTVLSASGTLNAIDYALKRWVALTRYLDDGRYPIDNNGIENAIRPIALGRKNWLFAGSERAGEREAVIMGLLATAKANGHEPHAWLSDVLTRLPTTKDRDIGTLLPHTWKPTTA